MGKKERSFNPTDVLRKQQKKKELKKNKEDRDRTRLVKQTKKLTLREENELIILNNKSKDGSITATERLRLTAIRARWDQANEARTKLGLEPRQVPDKVNEPKKPTSEKVYKYYHPTFNPHGIKKSQAIVQGNKDEEGLDEEKVEEDDGLYGERVEKEDDAFQDLSWIPIPHGEAPETEGQTYYALKLPEIRDINAPASEFESESDEEESGDDDDHVQNDMKPIPTVYPSFQTHPLPPHAFLPGMMIPPPPFMPPGVIPPPGAIPGMSLAPGFPIPPPPFIPAVPLPHPSFRVPFPFIPPGMPMPPQQPSLEQDIDTSSAPALPSAPISSSASTGAVVSSAPQLRDLQKEATRMVPLSLKRKKHPR